MVREVELEEMEKKWKADNERIMREYAAANPAAAPAPAPAPEPAPAMEPLAEAPAAIPAPAGGAAPVTEGER